MTYLVRGGDSSTMQWKVKHHKKRVPGGRQRGEDSNAGMVVEDNKG
jgi:hypothetical protein